MSPRRVAMVPHRGVPFAGPSDELRLGGRPRRVFSLVTGWKFKVYTDGRTVTGRGAEMAELVSQAAFARAVGVSRMAITKAVQAGRLQPYDETGRPVSPDFRGRKFLKLEEARRSFDESRVRLDNWFLTGERRSR